MTMADAKDNRSVATEQPQSETLEIKPSLALGAHGEFGSRCTI